MEARKERRKIKEEVAEEEENGRRVDTHPGFCAQARLSELPEKKGRTRN